MHIWMIEWDDACSGQDWTAKFHQEHIDPIVTFGVIVREDDRELEVVPNYGTSNKLNQITIPAGCIRRRRILHVAGERDKDTLFSKSFLVPPH